MSTEFVELMARFRGGDAAAAAELIERFGGQIRRAIRIRGTGSRVQRVFDSEDVYQSVLRTFWEQRGNPGLRAAGPGQLVEWLLEVARNRRTGRTNAALAAKRGGLHVHDGAEGVLESVPNGGRTFLSEIEDRDLLRRVFALLSSDERRIAEARADGVEWQELAEREGTTAEALRIRYRRAMARVLEAMRN